jgi:hypothetical protein
MSILQAYGGAQSTPPQTIETPEGTKLPFNLVANQIREPITGSLSSQQFAARLQAGGTLSLDDNAVSVGAFPN